VFQSPNAKLPNSNNKDSSLQLKYCSNSISYLSSQIQLTQISHCPGYTKAFAL